MLRLADFEGAWKIHRVIEGTPMAGDLVGELEFWREGGGLIYRERGYLTLASGTGFTAAREYRWAQAGERIEVTFADGRDFHSFDPDGITQARHWCDPDTYDVTYDFTGWPVWTSRWEVHGPAKDYLMLTRHERR